MSLIISTLVTLVSLGSTLGQQDDIQRNHIQNDISFQNQQNQEYFVQQRPMLQNYPQHYVPVPIQLLQRSVYTQQPQAALIIVKAFPVYLTPAQAANIQGHSTQIHQNVAPRIPNVQTIHYNAAPAAPVFSTAQPAPVFSTAQPAPERPAPSDQTNNFIGATNPGLYFAPPSNVQGDSYLNQLAQVVAQQYTKSPSNFKAPAIIAGLENFSAEQQKQIKAHLKNYITSHADEENQAKDRDSSSSETKDKYSSKIHSSRSSQQSEWRPSLQPTATKRNN